MWWKTGFGLDDFQGVVRAQSEVEARQKWWENRCASHPSVKESMEEEGGFSEVWARPINDDDGFVVVE